ncbi:MAG: AbrB/MazE/SpoVT family DNA-binding domain-containing protein [Dehalococcoidia bacterium]|nr:AbrB/MazE/SpoVT family DNA-binding domain-containing protein [Dehalococcoidia bacterium]
MNEVKTRMSKDGRLVVPATLRKALGIKPGDEVVIIVEEGELRVLGAFQAIARAQALVRRYVPEGRSLSQELIQERREEASRA